MSGSPACWSFEERERLVRPRRPTEERREAGSGKAQEEWERGREGEGREVSAWGAGSDADGWNAAEQGSWDEEVG